MNPATSSAVFAERFLSHEERRLEIKLYVQGGSDWTLNVSTLNGLDDIPGSTELGRFSRPEQAMNALYRRVTLLTNEGYTEGRLAATQPAEVTEPHQEDAPVAPQGEYRTWVDTPDAAIEDVVEAVRERAARCGEWASRTSLMLSGVHGTALDRAVKAGVVEERYRWSHFEYRAA